MVSHTISLIYFFDTFSLKENVCTYQEWDRPLIKMTIFSPLFFCLGCLEQLGKWYLILWAAQANQKEEKEYSLVKSYVT